MENPQAIKKQSATIICRYLRRVISRNCQHDSIQRMLSKRVQTNDSTIMGVPLSDLPVMYHYRIPVGKVCYTHDIRSLMHMLKTGFATAKCPYTNRRFTRYQKYLIMRHYYSASKLSNFIPFCMEHVIRGDYMSCSSQINYLLTGYDQFDIETIGDTHLFNLLTELIKYNTDDRIKTADYVSLAHHHYINGNMRNFRFCVYLVLMDMIEESSDRDLTVLKIKMRIQYIRDMYPESDPIVVMQSPWNNIRNLINQVISARIPASSPPTSPPTSPPSSSGASLDLYDDEPPRQRRRIDDNTP